MGLFNRKNEQTEPKRVTISSTDSLNEFMQIPRADGSIIHIRQEKDEMGYPRYEQIAGKLLAKLQVIAPELQPHSQKGILTRAHQILIDFPNTNDMQKINDPYYLTQIANVLLASNRIKKIVDEYHNYAGGINLDSNGNVINKFVDSNVLKNLEMTAQERAMQAAAQTQTAPVAKTYIENTPYNPQFEAGKLSPDMLPKGYHSNGGYDR